MKIVFFEPEAVEKSSILESAGDCEFFFIDQILDKSSVHLAKEAEVVSVFVNSKIDKEVIEAMPNLKFIVTRSMGYDHIDLAYCKEKGIKVSNVPAYGAYTVAEFTFALLLNLSRKVIQANGKSHSEISGAALRGFDLRGKTIGVVGTGKIGKNVIQIANGFGMKVVACDLYPDLDFAKEKNFAYKNLDEVLAESDVITLHAPYTKENHHLINKEKIKKMKRGVYFLNTARGALLDTEALLWGLNEGIIAGAGLDVVEDEIKLPNTIITPHIAFYTREAEAEIVRITIQNLQSFISNTPLNLIN